jgi:two-component system, sensor histidine kinase
MPGLPFVRRASAVAAAALLGHLSIVHGPTLAEGMVLRFDGALAILVGIVLGWRWGVATAVGATLAFWTPPPLMPLLAVSEAAMVVGLIGRGWFPMLASATFWVVVGVPFFWLLYPVFVRPDPELMPLLEMKQLLNGMVNAGLAQGLATVPVVRKLLGASADRPETLTLRTQLTRFITPLITLPVLLLGLALGRMFVTQLEAAAAGEAREHASVLAERTTAYMVDAERNIRALAFELSVTSMASADVQAAVLRTHALSDSFLTMLVADAAGGVMAGSTLIDSARPRAAIGTPSVADRDYFTEVVRTRTPFRSSVFRGRGFGNDIIVALSAPILEPGTGSLLGVVEGSLDLRRLSRSLANLVPDEGMSATIVDGEQRVVSSAGPDQRELLSSTEGWGAVAATVGRQVADFTGPSADEQYRGRILVARQVVPALGWTAYVTQPYRIIQRPIVPFYQFTLLALLLSLALSVALAWRGAAQVTEPIEKLATAVSAVGDTARADAIPVPSGEDAPLEVVQLSEAFGGAMTRLEHASATLRDTLQDLDRRVQVRTEELAEATARAERANAAKSQFLANMSHEIRTPLNGVIGIADVLHRTPLDEDQREMVDTIRSSGTVLMAVINDILDYSKIEAGRMTFERAPFSLRDTLDDVVRVLAPAADPKGLRLTMALEGDVPALVVGDRVRLSQILLNVAGNAVKFTDRGDVAMVARRSEADRIRIEVRDTGIGIAPDRLPFIFDAFEQADTSTTRRFGGTGLGLAICRRLAEQMGGALTAKSVPGEGSVFSLELPLPAASPVPAPVVDPDTPAAAALPHRVLVAEDNPVNQRVMQLSLTRLGVETDLAADGVEALAALERQAYAVVMMDVQMPTVDGLEATRQVRANPARYGTPWIIALTAHALDEHRDECAAAGMNDYLSKPVTLDHIRAVLERASPAVVK